MGNIKQHSSNNNKKEEMKLLVTFALLALVSVVYCEKVWVDVKEKCPEGEGWAVKRFGGPVKSICVTCKTEDKVKSPSCNNPVPRTTCEKWKEMKYCQDDNKFAWYVQDHCTETCGICKLVDAE